MFNRYSTAPAPFPNISRKLNPRGSLGMRIGLTNMHQHRAVWYKLHRDSIKPHGIEHHPVMPRILLDRHLYALKWNTARNLPDETRWEKVYNGMRYAVERVHWVEEDGFLHRVNWKLYSDRVNAELQAAVDALPQFTVRLKSIPMSWRKLDIAAARIRGLSMREAVAQCKVGEGKGCNVLGRALDIAQKGAETKGLDKERLRLGTVRVTQGQRDKQADIRSRGYYAWKTKKSSHLFVTVIEDPELRLPDRTRLPYASQVALRRAGIATEPVVLDVPAITAEGI
jgi:ribosomal protein L22